ncbi:hypothetical protein ANN_09003 [Periplaneta americana]|uniref:Uncharacterized protein n=1 Tax=Periplaneta americana TaxID=6978 RepID=A0ABQ8TNQ9_PERAM|nr:hypothetical protein ANN_09003 [Periplaneta americana]
MYDTRAYHRTPVVEGGTKWCFRFLIVDPKIRRKGSAVTKWRWLVGQVLFTTACARLTYSLKFTGDLRRFVESNNSGYRGYRNSVSWKTSSVTELYSAMKDILLLYFALQNVSTSPFRHWHRFTPPIAITTQTRFFDSKLDDKSFSTE